MGTTFWKNVAWAEINADSVGALPWSFLVSDRWNADDVEVLAPDTPSWKAARTTSRPGAWGHAGLLRRPLVWGECPGSGSRSYRVAVHVDADNGPACTCSCPSRKTPCKHVLGLLLRWTRDELFEGAPPEWAGRWISRRTARRARPSVPEGARAAVRRVVDDLEKRFAERTRSLVQGAIDRSTRTQLALRGPEDVGVVGEPEVEHVPAGGRLGAEAVAGLGVPVGVGALEFSLLGAGRCRRFRGRGRSYRRSGRTGARDLIPSRNGDPETVVPRGRQPAGVA